MKKLHLLPLALFATLSLSAAEPEIRYVDASTLTVIGKAMPTEQPYNRIDTTRYKATKATRNHCYYPTGMAVVFRTDSPVIKARWTTTGRTPGVNWTAIAQKGLDLYIRRDGKWVTAGVGRPKVSGKNNQHEDTIINDMAPGEKECLLYLPLYDALSKLELGVTEGSEIVAMENPFRHKIVVYGSSITHGASASRSGMAYPAQLERSTGLYFVNLGFSGQCLMQPEFATYLADVETEAFVFDAFSNPSAAIINERFDAFVDALRRTHPTTPLIFLQTEVRESGNFNTKTEQFESEKRAAAEQQIRERMKSDKHLYFVDPGNLLGTDHEATVDGTHPTDLGFERILDAVQPSIVKILAKYGIK